MEMTDEKLICVDFWGVKYLIDLFLSHKRRRSDECVFLKTLNKKKSKQQKPFCALFFLIIQKTRHYTENDTEKKFV